MKVVQRRSAYRVRVREDSELRVRVWRALKATGAGTLREGVYVLPATASTAPALRDIEKTIAAAGAFRR